LAPALGELELRGPLSCQWNLSSGSDPTGGADFEANMTVEPAAHLAVGRSFVKPAGQKMRVSVAGHAVSRGPATALDRDVDLTVDKLDVEVGKGRLHADGAELRLRRSTGGGTSVTVEAEGRFDIFQVEFLTACFPELKDATKGISGDIGNGRYRISPGPGRQAVEISADITDLGLEFDPLFVKPAGQSAELSLTYTREETSGQDAHQEIDLTASLLPPPNSGEGAAGPRPLEARARVPIGKASGKITFDEAAVELALRAADLLRLAKCCPALGEQLKGRALKGVSVSGRIGMRVKSKGSLSAEIDSQGPLRVKFGGSKLKLNCKASGRLAGFGETENASVELEQIDLGIIVGKLSVDDALLGLLPELKGLADEYGIAGTLGISADVHRDSDAIRISSAEIDAENLSIAHFGPVRKPAGRPARLRIKATIDSDLSRAALEELSGRVGEISLRAAGTGHLEFSERDRRPALGDWRLRLAAATKHAEALEEFLPALAKLNLTGGVSAEMELTGGKEITATRAKIVAEGLSGRYKNRDLRFRGELELEDVRAREGGFPSIGRARTDGLEASIGKSHMWLVGDVRNVHEAPAGTLRVLATHLDDEDLAASLKALTKPEEPPSPATESASDKPGSRAEQTVRAMRDWLGNADLKATVSARHLKKYDKSVRQYYDVRCLELDAQVTKGKCRLSYVGGLNGGRVSGKYLVDLTRPTAIVESQTEFKDVIASESIQPQMAKYFPGNRVKGYFNRSEELKFPLVDLVGDAIGTGGRTRSSGKAKTVTIDGTVTGRAAPEFISSIFPGLNLATYQYKRMTGFAELKEDGSAENDMIFEGRLYDLYITGTTDTKNIGRYQIGVILLSAPQSPEWNHAYRLGRIPVLNFEARIEAGEMHDVKVSYLRPDEIIGAILLTNNPLYRVLFGE
jgi:hypothetical protein